MRRSAHLAVIITLCVGLAFVISAPGTAREANHGHLGPAAVAGAIVYGLDQKSTSTAPDWHDLGKVPPAADPFPILRIFRTEPDLSSLPPGPYQRIRRTEFETQVRTAAALLQSRERPVRLIQAHYQANVHGRVLSGTANWKFSQPHPGGSWVNLDPLGVAIHSPKWDTGDQAVLYRDTNRTGTAVRLRIDDPSQTQLNFEWSAATIVEPRIERYELVLPSAALATLDLEVDQGQEPIVPSGVLLTGPYPTSNLGRTRWEIRFGGLTRLDLGLRKIGEEANIDTAIKVDRTTRYSISPSQTTCQIDLQLRALRGMLNTAVIELDPQLQLVQVISQAAGPSPTWKVLPGEKRNDPSLVRIALPDPLRESDLRLIAVAVRPPVSGKAWSLPKIRVHAGISGVERTELHVDPDYEIDTFEPGDYRITESSVTADQGHRLTLIGTFPIGTGPPPGGERRPASLTLKRAEPRYSSIEKLDWHLQPGRLTLVGHFRITALRGPVSQIPFRIPNGYTVRSIELDPIDSEVAWTNGPESGVISVQPSRAVPTGNSLEIRLLLQGPVSLPAPDLANVPSQTRTLTFPQIIPLHAVSREGNYDIQIAPALSARVSTTSEHVITQEPASANSVIHKRIQYVSTPPSGTVLLYPADIYAEVVDEIHIVETMDNDRTVVMHQLHIRLHDSEAGSVTLFLPESPDITWDIQVDSPIGASVQKLAVGNLFPWTTLLGSTTSWDTMVTTGISASGPQELWRVILPSSGTNRIDLSVKAVSQKQMGHNGIATLRLPIVAGVDPAAMTVELSPDSYRRYEQIPRRETTEVSVQSRKVHSLPLADGVWDFAQLQLHSHVGLDGVTDCVFSGVVAKRRDNRLSIELPPGAHQISVRCDGFFVDSPMLKTGQDSNVVEIPLCQESNGTETRFEILYRVSAQWNGVLATVLNQPPILPGDNRPVPGTVSIDRDYYRLDTIIPDVVTGQTAPNRITVVRRSTITALATILAVLVTSLGLGLIARRDPHSSRWLGLVAAILGIVVWFGSPQLRPVVLPSLIAGLILLMGCRKFRKRPDSRSSGSTASYRASSHQMLGMLCSAFLILVSAAAVCLGQREEPAVVVIVPSATNPGDLDVLVPQSTLDRLRRISESEQPGAVILAADYHGTASETQATFDVVYSIRCLTPGDQILSLPLSRVRLAEAILDGRTAYPEVIGPEQYRVTVNGIGDHQLRLRFDVAVTTPGSDREIRFGIPEVPDCRLTFTPPDGGVQPVVGSARGSQTIEGGKIIANHGAGNEVILRWRGGETVGAKAAVSVREAIVWDLGEGDALVTAALAYRIDGGTVNRFDLELPDSLEPGQIIVRPTDAKSSSSTVGLREWTLTPRSPGRNTLGLSLQSPVAGRVTVIVILHPRAPIGTRPTLHVPRALGASETDSYYALRTRSILIEDVNRFGMIDYPAEAIAKDFTSISPELELNRLPPTRVFRRTEGPQARIVPVLQSSQSLRNSGAEVTWTIGDEIKGNGRLSLSSMSGPRGWAEFELPAAVSVTEVRSPGMIGWDRSGNRIHIWLKNAVTNLPVEWSGSVRIPKPNRGTSDSTPIPLNLPVPRTATTTGISPILMRVVAVNGWTVEPGDSKDIVPHLAPPDGIGDVYHVASAVPSVPFLAYPPAPPAGARCLDLITRDGGSIVYRFAFAAPVRPGRPQTMTLRLSDLDPEANIQIRPETGVIPTRLQTDRGQAEWLITSHGNIPDAIRLTITVHTSLKPNRRIPLTSVWLGGKLYPLASRHLVLGRDITLTQPHHLGSPAQPSERNRLAIDFPDEAREIASSNCYRVPAWQQTIRVNPASTPMLPVPATQPVTTRSPPAETVPGTSLNDATDGISIVKWLSSAGLGLIWLAAVIGMMVYGQTWAWPERFVLCSVLASLVLGFSTLAGLLFLGVAAFGGLGRLVSLISRPRHYLA